jgi:hypothetical protein
VLFSSPPEPTQPLREEEMLDAAPVHAAAPSSGLGPLASLRFAPQQLTSLLAATYEPWRLLAA